MLNHSTKLTGLANHFVVHGLLDINTAMHAQENAVTEHLSFVNFLVSRRILSANVIVDYCKQLFELDYVDLEQSNIHFLENSSLTTAFIQQYRVIPLKKINRTLQIGMTDPTDQQAMEAVTFHTGLLVQPVLVNDEQLTRWLEKNSLNQAGNKQLQINLLKQIHLDDSTSHIQENIIRYDEPMIQFVNNIISYAFQKNASDIHIEPFETHCRVRFRLHGVLQEMESIPPPLARRVTTRIKVMSKLDIAEKRLPQDGRFQFQNMDIRVNTCPTQFGEKIVLRILNAGKISLEIDQLQLSARQKELFLQAIAKPQGMILVTGPTGSGKTVTLYSALNFLNTIEKNISTVEDPIEINLPGINQVSINSKIGLHFSTMLRTFLRQDPDIIMVGEIRDRETAEIAMQAAQTGHLVLSTLHTNSAIETITRLLAMGMPAYQIASSVSLIIAQRLVRKLCLACKEREDKSMRFRARGCQHCINGFVERIGVYEFLPLSRELVKLIVAGSEGLVLLTQARNEGFISLRDAALKKVDEGITSLAEVNRVVC